MRPEIQSILEGVCALGRIWDDRDELATSCRVLEGVLRAARDPEAELETFAWGVRVGLAMMEFEKGVKPRYSRRVVANWGPLKKEKGDGVYAGRVRLDGKSGNC